MCKYPFYLCLNLLPSTFSHLTCLSRIKIHVVVTLLNKFYNCGLTRLPSTHMQNSLPHWLATAIVCAILIIGVNCISVIPWKPYSNITRKYNNKKGFVVKNQQTLFASLLYDFQIHQTYLGNKWHNLAVDGRCISVVSIFSNSLKLSTGSFHCCLLFERWHTWVNIYRT